VYNYSDSYSDFEKGRHDRPSKEQRCAFQKRAIRRELRRQRLRDLRALTLRSDYSFQSKDAGQASEYPAEVPRFLRGGPLGQATLWTVRQDRQTTFAIEVADEQQLEQVPR
jgi:hypothetical protein